MDYDNRRRMQNRVAQQKFRERSKKQKQSKSSPSHNHSLITDLHCLPDDQMHERPSMGSIPNIPHSLPPQGLDHNLFSRQHSEVGDCGPQFPRICSDGKTQVPMSLSINEPRVHEFLLEDLGIDNFSHTQENPQQLTPMSNTPMHEPRSMSQETQHHTFCQPGESEYSSEDRIRDKALVTLQRQRAHLGRQAEDLISQLVSIYDLGVSLEIFDSDPHLKQVLETVNNRFSSMWN